MRTICHCSVPVLGLLDDKSTFYTAESILANENTKTKTDGWHKIEESWERMVLFVLSQVVYKEYEEPDETLLEVEFAFPPPTDLIKILWVNEQPVGFYSVKVKGTLDPVAMECYRMTTLDTLFIRRDYRGQGWGSSAVKDLLLEFPQENIGFSFPISIPMNRVLKKYLEVTPSDRPRFWEVTGCGTEGNTRNLWLMSRRQPPTSSSRITASSSSTLE
ncbi:protein FAM169B isoform X2 [Folsomia candida]|uniref:protein FAM169B isoform X2 n=1 Tax=Folsomia candida TaxID=158441 RepID=UPI001604AF6F|nr:protein FAM169B isoform X2 [Folsomia candida]